MDRNPGRLLSLDFFRGATVGAMILVNNPGDWGNIYAPLEHAVWNGCTPTDLVFPFFLFIVGVSIAYAMGSRKDDLTSHQPIMMKALKRAFILFGLGLFLNLFPEVFRDPVDAFKNVRIPGVLQRIGLVFFISSILFLKNTEKTLFKIALAILVVYWALMAFVPVPGVGFANLEKENNLGAWLDRSILTEAHLWASSKTWDPEGILGTLPAVATCLFGVLAGICLRRNSIDAATKVAWLFSAGTIAVILGLTWDLQFPINKALWTSSYVLFSGGLATMMLALSFWIIDVQKYSGFTTPFAAYGTNAITAYFISGLLPALLNMITIRNAGGTETGLQTWMYSTFYLPYFTSHNASLAWAISFVLALFMVLWIMYKRKIIIKI